MKKISRLLMSAVLIWIGIGLTSCEELQNALDNPVSPSLKVNTPSVTLQAGSTAQCNVSASSKARLLYETSDENIVTVDASGLMTAVAPGEATIYVTATNQDGQDIFFDQAGQIAVKVTPLWDENNPMPLSFEAAVDNASVTFKFAENATPDYKKVEYSLDGGITWTALSSPNQPIVLEKTGDRVMFRGSNSTYNGEAQFVVEQNTAAGTRSWQELAQNNIFKVLASVGRLTLRERNSASHNTLKENTFKNLFKNCAIDIETSGPEAFQLLTADVALPAGAYEGMFAGTPITYFPELPAIYLGTGCYKNMFYDCSQAKGTANLPAQTLQSNCYEGMFYGCSSLEGVTIGATTVADGTTVNECVKGMLNGTSNVNVILSKFTEELKQEIKQEVINQIRGILSTQGTDITFNNKKPATISFKSLDITKVVGDAPFINELTNTGDGVVTYNSSNVNVATVNSKGEITIKNSGEATIFAIVKDTDNYSYAKGAFFTLTVNPKPAEEGEGGQGSGEQQSGEQQQQQEAAKPTAASISFASSAITKTEGDAAFTNKLTNTGDGTVKYTSDNSQVATVNETSGEVNIIGAGTATITATVADTDKYDYEPNTVSYTLTVKEAQPSDPGSNEGNREDYQKENITF